MYKISEITLKLIDLFRCILFHDVRVLFLGIFFQNEEQGMQKLNVYNCNFKVFNILKL